MSKYFRYLLLVIFFATVFIIVFLQFNSNRSINLLIDGNEKLLNELNLKSELKTLQTSILRLDNKMRGTILRGVQISDDHLHGEISQIESHLNNLLQFNLDDNVQNLDSRLKDLVKDKITFIINVKDSFALGASHAAALMILNTRGKQISDSINSICTQIDAIQQAKLTTLIEKADADGKSAKTLGTIIALIAAIASFITFLYVSYRVKAQQLLIFKLNESEKKVREAAKVKENFLANMSHEIRTPMNAILGFANLLKTEDLTANGKEYLKTIQDSGSKMLGIINDILDFSKIESGMMRIDSSPFDIRAALHSVKDLFFLQLQKKNIQLVTYIDPSIPTTLVGDANRLMQILVNLLSNAIKFTENGYITLKVEQEKCTDTQMHLLIEVEDTGIGIETEKLSQIFERFSQAEETTTRQYGGTGLGLAIVKQLLELQGGSIEVKSSVGKGTLFTIHIAYLLLKQDITVVKKIMPLANENTLSHTPCILIVEDNIINQRLLYHWFRMWNVQYDMANNGTEAIEKMAYKPYDLILMDMQMPVMDGYTATSYIRNTLSLSTPIIGMTAYAMPGDREKCLRAGMNDYVVKPLVEEDLKQLLLRYIGKLPEEKNDIVVNNDSYSVIDLNYLKQLSRGDQDYEKEMLNLFIEKMGFHIASLQKSATANDPEAIKKEAHSIKSTISIVGLTQYLGVHLDTLEMGNQKDAFFVQEQINEIIKITSQAMEEVKTQLRKYS